MSVLAKCVEDGFIPLSNNKHRVAWASNNVYRDMDKANTEIPQPSEADTT